MGDEHRHHSHHHHHHGHDRTGGGKLAFTKGRLIAILAFWVVLLGGLWLGGKLLDGSEPETKGSLEGRFRSETQVEYNGTTYGYRDHYLTTTLVLGVDNESLSNSKSGGYRSGGQADFLMLLVADREKRTVTPIQIDRDTITIIRIYGVFGNISSYRNTQLCLAQAFGNTVAMNCENTSWAVSNLLLGIPIDHFVAIDMASINRLNDALGGITVTIDEDLTSISPEMVPGATVTLHGEQAEQFVRSRRTVSDGTNISRMGRQRAFMTGLETVLRQRLASDSDTIGQLYDLLGSDLATDMSRGTLVNEAYTMSQYEMGEIRTLDGTGKVGDDGYKEFHVDSERLNELIISTCFEAY